MLNNECPKSENIDVEIGRTISILHRQHKLYVKQRVKKYGLNSTQFRVLLMILNNDGVTQSQVNSVYYFDKGVLARLIKSLEAGDFIYREVCETDKRVQYLYPTEKAKTLAPEFYEMLGQYAKNLGRGIDLYDKEKVYTYLQIMLSNVIEGNEGLDERNA